MSYTRNRKERTVTNLSDVLYKAAEIASERGHCKNIEEDGAGRVCFIGAVNLALGFDASRLYSGHDEVATRNVIRILITAGHILKEYGLGQGVVPYYGDMLDSDIPSAISWNNQEHTSGEDVVWLLKQTGAEFEAQERGHTDAVA
jgi:hypothetical protein